MREVKNRKAVLNLRPGSEECRILKVLYWLIRAIVEISGFEKFGSARRSRLLVLSVLPLPVISSQFINKGEMGRWWPKAG